MRGSELAGTDIFIETFKLPERDAVQIRITYTIDGLAVRAMRGPSNPRLRLFEVFKNMHIAALKFVSKLIMENKADVPRGAHVIRPLRIVGGVAFSPGELSYESREPGWVDAEIVD